jgi:hypothetical protein
MNRGATCNPVIVSPVPVETGIALGVAGPWARNSAPATHDLRLRDPEITENHSPAWAMNFLASKHTDDRPSLRPLNQVSTGLSARVRRKSPA